MPIYHISGLLSEEHGAVCIGQNMEQEPIVIRQLDDQGQSLRRLFHGIVTQMSVNCTRGVYTFELKAASHSYQMDIKVKRRSYQDIHRTYDDLVTALVRKYQYGDAIDTVTNYAKLDTFVLQYEETDWALLKRLASRFGSVLVPEVTAASPKVFFGMPEGKQHKVERDVFYRVRKTFHEPDAEKPGEQRAGSYVTYMIESLQYYALGDFITLPIGQGKELVVVRAVTTLTDGLLRTRYDLQAEQDIRYARYENDQATGISLTGTVLMVQQDFVQLQLDIDPKQDPVKACWFPVAARYVAEEHTGWYDMPEIGEQVELYLPTHREQDAYVTDSLRQQRHANGQPNVKVWQHVQGSGVEMSEQELTLSTSDGFSITLHEDTGITINSPGNVQIQGGHVKLDAGEELSLEAGTALYLKGGASSMVLDGETDIKAPVIDQEGTVKAPVFVADLPPVPEPPLMSIKAYEAAQSAAKSSQAPTPKAKITTPAELQKANALMGTISKLLGSIPVVGNVANVMLNTVGGPAGKVAATVLQATASIPIRSKGTPTVGGSSKGSEVHPLKYLAGLATQGLISLHEHEKAKQAYYNKWILGKVYTSARHIAHSGSTLELVQNLLKESNAMVHAYQQVPKSVQDKMLRDYKEQEKARIEAALKAEKENSPPKISDEEYEKIHRDYVYWASLEDRRPEIPLGSYRAEDGVVRKANGDPDFKYYDDWKQNYPGDFLILSNQVGITPEEQRWMSYANLFAEPVPLDGRGGEGRALKNEFSKMSKEGASENARLARENVRRIQQRIDQKSITTKNASEPIENASETVPSKPNKTIEKPPKTKGKGTETLDIDISQNLIDHILNRHSVNSTRKQLPYLQKKMSDKQIDEMLGKKSFFNKDWSDDKIVEASKSAIDQLKK